MSSFEFCVEWGEEGSLGVEFDERFGAPQGSRSCGGRWGVRRPPWGPERGPRIRPSSPGQNLQGSSSTPLVGCRWRRARHWSSLPPSAANHSTAPSDEADEVNLALRTRNIRHSDQKTPHSYKMTPLPPRSPSKKREAQGRVVPEELNTKLSAASPWLAHQSESHTYIRRRIGRP